MEATIEETAVDKADNDPDKEMEDVDEIIDWVFGSVSVDEELELSDFEDWSTLLLLPFVSFRLMLLRCNSTSINHVRIFFYTTIYNQTYPVLCSNMYWIIVIKRKLFWPGVFEIQRLLHDSTEMHRAPTENPHKR